MKNSLLIKTKPGLLVRRNEAGLDASVVTTRHLCELSVTARPLPGESPAAMLQRVYDLLEEHEASIVRHEVFGSVAVSAEYLRAMEQVFGDVAWPITWVEGGACTKGPLAGMHILAVGGAKVETIRQNGRPVGRMFDDGYLRHCLMSGIHPQKRAASRAHQTRQTFELLENALNQAGMNFSHVVRTWLFLDDISSWYASFNEARTKFFRQRHLFDHLLPASTGIGGKNPHGTAIVASAWAMQPINGFVTVREVPSPLQCPPSRYGSSFSRAVEIIVPGLRRVLVSGTASIDATGHTTFVGDVKGQIRWTFDVVGAILAACKLRFSDVSRATAYFRDPTDAGRFRSWCTKQGIKLPVVMTQANICRDQLLFEIEVDAIALQQATESEKTVGDPLREVNPSHLDKRSLP